MSIHISITEPPAQGCRKEKTRITLHSDKNRNLLSLSVKNKRNISVVNNYEENLFPDGNQDQLKQHEETIMINASKNRLSMLIKNSTNDGKDDIDYNTEKRKRIEDLSSGLGYDLHQQNPELGLSDNRNASKSQQNSISTLYPKPFSRILQDKDETTTGIDLIPQRKIHVKVNLIIKKSPIKRIKL